MSEKLTLHKYQSDITGLMIEHKAFGVFAEPGTGKTPTSLYVVNHFRQKTLVIAPIRIAYSVWPPETKKWSDFNNIKTGLLHGLDKEQRFLDDSIGIYIINPEGLVWLESMVAKHKRFPFTNLIVDESAKFKSPSSKRFKALKRVIGLFKRRYILAGNPMPNSYMDLWAQIFLLDRGERLGRTISAYRNRFFTRGGFRGYEYFLRPGAEEEIKDLIKDICIFIKATDHLDLPKLVINDIRFDLPKGLRKKYRVMEKQLFWDLDEGKILASSAAVANSKCQQIAQGFLFESLSDKQKYDKVTKKVYDLHNIKIELLEELVDELNGSPLLVGYWFRPDYDKLKKAFPKAVYFADSSKSEAVQIEKDWNAGKIPLLIGNIASISHGLNLQKAGNHVCFYTMVWNYDMYDQFIKRVLRQGNDNDRVFVHRIIANKTMEEAMIMSMQDKSAMSSGFLNAINLYREKIKEYDE